MALSREQTTRLAYQRFGFGLRLESAPSQDPREALRGEAAQGRVAQPKGPELMTTAEAFDQLDEFRTARKAAREKADSEKTAAQIAASSPPSAMMGETRPPLSPAVQPAPQRIFRAEAEAHLNAALEADIGFSERLVWFWSNHFAVAVNKSQPVRVSAGTMEREAIRPHVFGRFADMLQAVEKHPAMLFYLDNRQSIGPNSKAGERRGKGLNENLAREILELHTLGVTGGYTQADVTSLAKILTGWTVIGPQDEDGILGNFYFNANRHEPGPQSVLGKTYAQSDEAQGEAALKDIARHPATAAHIAEKLARHFIADEPPPALVKRLAEVFRKTDGDLKAVSLALLDAPESWEPEARKLRSPQEFVVAGLRAMGVWPNLGVVLNVFNALGQPLWQPNGPNGFADTQAQWLTPEGMKTRLDVATGLVNQLKAPLDPLELAAKLYGESVSQETRQAISRAESRKQGLALLLLSPEFQRR